MSTHIYAFFLDQSQHRKLQWLTPPAQKIQENTGDDSHSSRDIKFGLFASLRFYEKRTRSNTHSAVQRLSQSTHASSRAKIESNFQAHIITLASLVSLTRTLSSTVVAPFCLLARVNLHPRKKKANEGQQLSTPRGVRLPCRSKRTGSACCL